jgi:hypothetical protein
MPSTRTPNSSAPLSMYSRRMDDEVLSGSPDDYDALNQPAKKDVSALLAKVFPIRIHQEDRRD